MPSAATIYDTVRLFLAVWFLCAASGIAAGAGLALLLFRYREPRQREREGRLQVAIYGGVAGLALGVVLALLLVPAQSAVRLLWLLFAVWTGGMAAVAAGLFTFKLKLLAHDHGLPLREAARNAAIHLLGGLRVPAAWLAPLGPPAAQTDGSAAEHRHHRHHAGHGDSEPAPRRPRQPAGDLLPPQRDPLPNHPVIPMRQSQPKPADDGAADGREPPHGAPQARRRIRSATWRAK